MMIEFAPSLWIIAEPSHEPGTWTWRVHDPERQFCIHRHIAPLAIAIEAMVGVIRGAIPPELLQGEWERRRAEWEGEG